MTTLTAPMAQLASAMDSADPYLSVEEVSRRLGLPEALLLRRLEAGDVPSRTVENGDGTSRYEVRLSDLGIEPSADDDGDTDLEMVGVAQMAESIMAPERSRSTAVAAVSPMTEISAMSLDPRELVAGLLDRWERTLEQRIYAEQRQRFETELLARQTMVKQLQMEVKTARAEHAAAEAEKDRLIADRENALENARRDLARAQQELEAARAKKRGWFFRR